MSDERHDLPKGTGRLPAWIETPSDLELAREVIAEIAATPSLTYGNRTVTRLATAVIALTAEVERMRAGLERIAKHPHSMYTASTASNGISQYDIGVADGHRCAGGDAANCLAELEAYRLPAHPGDPVTRLDPSAAFDQYLTCQCSDCRVMRLDILGDRLETLAANLAIAGALCEAFERGHDHGENISDWRPGCGRSVA